ncbi:MAG: metallophosphoesterase [Myxococcaceae bacterium]
MSRARFRVHVAMGDPQAPTTTVLSILEAHQLLGADGLLKPDVSLVSMGDHFDWGKAHERAEATADGTRFLSWLAAHPPEQVVILAGNHDLARVGELSPFATDADFEEAWVLAAAAWRGGTVDEPTQQRFLARYPHVPDAEAIARDFSCFAVEQRRLVTELLRTRRLRLAHAHRGLLLVHAGVTQAELAGLQPGAAPATAEAAAQQLNAFLDQRVDRWEDGPLDLTPLHRPGSARGGIARGVLFHRPARPPETPDPQFEGPPRRRYDPRHLPAAFPQAIGHIRDKKSRELLKDWADAAPAADGPLRSLEISDDGGVRYRAGTHPGARLYFLDAGMSHVSPQRYELFDLDARAPLTRTRNG